MNISLNRQQLIPLPIADLRRRIPDPVINIGSTILKADFLFLENELPDVFNNPIPAIKKRLHAGVILSKQEVQDESLISMSSDLPARIRFIHGNRLVTLNDCRLFTQNAGTIYFQSDDQRSEELEGDALKLTAYYLSNVVSRRFEKVVFVIGAGASAEQLPLGQDLLTELLNEGNSSDDLIRFLKTVFRIDPSLPACSRPTINEVLNLIEIALEKDEALTPTYKPDLLRELKRTIITRLLQLFTDLTTQIDSRNSYVQLVKNMVKMLTTGALEEVGFITLNYDPFLDQALIEAVGEENINYGIQLEPWGGCERRAINVSREKLRKPIQLVKFHGSMDWMFCPYCHKIYRISTGRALSQDMPQCSSDGTPLSWFLYPPMREKYFMPEAWLHLHMQAEELLRKADRVIFIGYSLSDEDAYFRYRVKRSLYRVENPVDIVVVDKTLKEEKRPTSVEKNYWHFFGPVDYRPVGFPAFSLAPF